MDVGQLATIGVGLAVVVLIVVFHYRRRRAVQWRVSVRLDIERQLRQEEGSSTD